jgi:hypothetical protein
LNFFPKRFIALHQAKLLLVVVWLHITILDSFYVSYSGPVFFWRESLQLHTLFIHMSIALLTLGLYFLLINLVKHFGSNKLIMTTVQPPRQKGLEPQSCKPENTTSSSKKY